MAAASAVLALLGAGALGISARPRAPARDGALQPPSASAVEPAVSSAAVMAIPTAAVGKPAAPVAPKPVITGERAPRHLEGPPATREVSFLLVPKGALVSIDEGPPEELFMKTKHLTLGPHTFRASVPPPSTCCEPLERAEEVKGDDGSNTPQQVSLSLKFRRAMLSSPSAPSGAQLHCPIPRIAGAASVVYQVHMSTLEQDISCEIDVPGLSTQRSSVTLRAGELTQVPSTDP